MTGTEDHVDNEFEENLDEQLRKTKERIRLLQNEGSKLFFETTASRAYFLTSGSYAANLSIGGGAHGSDENSKLSEKIEILAEFVFNLQQKHELLERELEVKEKQLRKGLSTIKHLEEEHKKLNEKFYSYVNNLENELSIQYLNTEIYLNTDNPDDIFKVYTAVLDFLEEIDFKVFVELEAVKGSWWKKFIAKSRGALTSEAVTSRLKEAEYALEVQILKVQSEVEKNQSEALTNIMVSLKDVPDAAIRIGSLLVVKVTNEEGVVSLNVQTLSLTQLHYLNKNPNLLNQPRNIWDQLSKENDDDNLQLNN